MRSCRPFCSGCPAWIRSGTIPSLIHHTASRDNPPTVAEAKGGPLSVRIASGSPRESRFRRWPHSLRVGLLHRLRAQRYRLHASLMVNGSTRLIAGAKPPLNRRTTPIRGVGVRERLAVRLGAAALLARHYQPRALHHLADRARRRPPPPRLVALQHLLQLPPPPTHVRLRSSSTAALPPPASGSDAAPAPVHLQQTATPFRWYRRSHTYPVSARRRSAHTVSASSPHPVHTPSQTDLLFQRCSSSRRWLVDHRCPRRSVSYVRFKMSGIISSFRPPSTSSPILISSLHLSDSRNGILGCRFRIESLVNKAFQP